MRPWMIVLASLAVGIGVAAALVWPELATVPRADLATGLLARLPAAAVVFLAVYALAALLLTTATLIGELLQLRGRLAPMIRQRGSGPERADWPAALAAAGRLRLLTPTALGRDPGHLPQHLLDPERLRGEVARLNYLGLARAQFFSALIVLTAVAALGLAQDHAGLSLVAQPIPTAATVLVLSGLILIAALARLAIDVAAEPLAQTLSSIQSERPEAALLRRAIDLLEAVRRTATSRPEGGAPPPAPALPERLAETIEDGHRALVEAAGRMSAAAEGLGATTQSSVEALEASLRARQADPPAEAVQADGAGIAELRGAVEALTALLERLSASPRATVLDATPAAQQAVPMPMAQPQLAHELRRLLQEIDAEA